jgi:hypothetical protein
MMVEMTVPKTAEEGEEIKGRHHSPCWELGGAQKLKYE